MRYIKLALAGIVLSTLAAQAQKKQFTITEATNGMASTLAPKGLKQVSWEPGTAKMYQVANDAWFSTHFPDGKVDTVLRLKELNDAINGKLKSIPSIKWIEKGYVYFQTGNDLKKGTKTAGGYMWESWVTLPEKAANAVIDKSLNIAYTIDNNLYLINKDKQTKQLTDDKDKDITNGASNVHRNEFGIEGGIFFSPNCNKLAYYHMDQTMVADYPIVNWLVTPAVNENVKYPMAGGTSHTVQLRIYSIASGKTTTVQTTGPKDQYLTNISWSPDERFIFIAIVNRAQDRMWLNQYDAETGMFIKTLFEEVSDKYIEPLHPMTFLPESNDKFIWWSQRDGYMHLYLYNTQGKLLQQLTKGKWVVNDILGMNKERQQIIIAAAKESPLEKHSYTINWNNGNIRRIDMGAGVHTALPNESGEYIYDVYSGAGVPKRTMVVGTNNGYSETLLDATNTLADYERPEIRNVTLYASDGTPLYGKLILPVKFNERKKYPVVVYLYNGPHVQLIRNTFPESGNLWYEYMAQRGYVVFTMDGRGSANRGYDFESAMWGKLGTVEMEDQLKGVAYLKSLPFVDGNRMGVHGWSFGGFMTTSLMLRHPGVFKVGVAGGPVMNWKMYEIMYTERYMNTPEENPQGYEDANLLTKTKNLQGKLLLIHGTDDATVVWQHSINFIKKAVDENVQVDYFVYPGYEHNVRGKDRVHLMQKITDYFDTYLK